MTGTITVRDAASRLGVSHGTAYAQIKAGTFPVPTLRIGRRIVVPTGPLDHLLAYGVLPVGSQGSDRSPSVGVLPAPRVPRPPSPHLGS